ncbi:MAG: hypothetical protein ACI9MR_003036 [Myxococcota bacterium]|jgi:hypothetical protein
MLHTSTKLSSLALLLVAACASAPDAIEVEPIPATVSLFNTTHTCSVGVAIELATGGRVIRVEPGESSVVEAVAGPIEVTLTPQGGTPAWVVWDLPAGPSERFLGCVAPEFLGQSLGRVAVTLTHHPHGCEPGRRAQVSVGLEGRPAAVLQVGETVTRWLPGGALIVELEGRYFPAERRAIEVTDDGTLIDIGCAVTDHGPSQPRPLTVLGPSLSCPVGRATVFEALGVRGTLARGEAWTGFAPSGVHAVRVGPSPDGAGETTHIALDSTGQVIESERCASVNPSD